ncbi:MAG: RsmE family RNA methyltransferase [Candidatus Bruticola sp.]
MRITRVFSSAPLQVGECFDLDAETCTHLTKSVRLRPGQEFAVFDNSGGEFICRLLEVSRRGAARGMAVSVSFPDTEMECRLRVCLSLVKGERFDWAVEKLTELGVAEIVPLLTEFTQVVDPGAAKRLRWQRLAVGAACQCGRVKIPVVTEPKSFAEALRQYAHNEECLLFSCHVPSLYPESPALKACTLFIGPEGGFSPEELSLAELSDCRFCSLGKRILRVETAALAAASRFAF